VFDLVAKAGSPEANGVGASIDDGTGILPGLPAVMGKPAHVAFDGGRTSNAGTLLLAAIEQRLGISQRLAARSGLPAADLR
jgi:hypothetical protein